MVLSRLSKLNAGNVELMVRGKLPGSHWDWKSGADFQFSNWQTEDAA